MNLISLKKTSSEYVLTALSYLTLGVYLLLLVAKPAVSNAAPNKHIVGFYEQWGIYSPNIHVNDLPLERLTHLIYQRATVDREGKVTPGDLFADLQHRHPNDNIEGQKFAGNFGQLLKAKDKHTNLKTLISIGGYQVNSLPYISRDANLLHQFTQSTVDFLKKYDFDGVDINWNPSQNALNLAEYNTTRSPHDYLALLKALKLSFDNEEALTGKRFLLSTNIFQEMLVENPKLVVEASQLTDWINLDTSRIFIPARSAKARHIAPLYATPKNTIEMENSVLDSVDSWIQTYVTAGGPPNKVVLTVSPAVYGWQGVAGMSDIAQSPSPGTWDTEQVGLTGKYSRKTLSKWLHEESYTQHWDDMAKMPWIYTPNLREGHFLSYENKRSIEHKITYIGEQALLGIGIIGLHSDSNDNFSLVKSIYHLLHPTQSSYLHGKEYFAVYHLHIILSTFFIFTIIILLIYIRKSKLKELSEAETNKQDFALIRDNGQRLEWHLTQLYLTLSSHNPSQLTTTSDRDDLYNYSKNLLTSITRLLSNTSLGGSRRTPHITPINLSQVVYYIQSTWPESKESIHITNRINDYDPVVCVDLIYLTQAISYLFDIFGFEELILFKNNNSNQITFTFSASVTSIFHPTYHSSYREIFLSIRYAGTTLVESSDHIEILFHEEAARLHERYSQLTPTFSITPESMSALPLEHRVKPKTDPSQSESNRLIALNNFSQSATETPDLGQLMIKACEFFHVEVDADLSITVYQGDSIISQLGTEVSTPEEQQERRIGEFRCLLKSNNTLTEEDQLYLNTLINHVQLVRQTLKNIVSKPVLLSELYKITSDKNRITHIKSDKGYVAVYLQGEKEPYYLSLRMRAIKQYFDDSSLFQVHRSYLVNPDKVEIAKKLAKKKFELTLSNGVVIPISRSYLPYAREYAPQWFEAKTR